MNPVVEKDVLDILNSAIDILKVREEKDVVELRSLSDHTIHDASIYQDTDSVSISILIYSIFKILERTGDKLGEKDYQSIYANLCKARDLLVEKRYTDYEKQIKTIFSIINKIDQKIGLYVEEVINKAKITKGANIFRHGFSIAKVSEIMGVSQWDLLNYIGKTDIVETEKPFTNMRSRLKFAKSLFK